MVYKKRRGKHIEIDKGYSQKSDFWKEAEKKINTREYNIDITKEKTKKQ